MLEMIALFLLTRSIGDRAAEKGYKPWVYKLLMIGLWFLFEFIFFFTGLFLFGHSIPVYLFGLFGGFTGYLITFLIVKNLKDKNEFTEL
jgi:hypothetical protein